MAGSKQIKAPAAGQPMKDKLGSLLFIVCDDRLP
jgi:hypothetical protein